MSEATKNKKYVSREERLRKAAEKAVATKESARAFLISAGVLSSNGKLAEHLK